MGAFWLLTFSHKKTICNPLAHPTWKCHHTYLWFAKLFHLTDGLLRSFRRCMEALKRASFGLSSVALKRTRCDVRMAINCQLYVRQAICHVQQVFRVTTFCINACFQSVPVPLGPWLQKMHEECTTEFRARLNRRQMIGASLQKIWKSYSRFQRRYD